LAVSDSFRRRWGDWHHIVDPQAREAVRTVVGCAAVAPCAWDADCMTSGLFLSRPEGYADLTARFQASYLVFFADGTVRVSENWNGELF
jgi:thiamine biosynthesis lipoprotein ApbE